MRRAYFQIVIWILFLSTVVLFITELSLLAADLKVFSKAKLISNPANDGDSFLVEANGNSYHVRLYYIDCPEISVGSKSMVRRLREQTRYFGLPSAVETVSIGKSAKRFVERILLEPFTLYTAFASGQGRSSKGRIYAFITTADGSDLISLLVKNGLARTFGVGRKTPDGVPRKEMVERLRDLETSAMLKRTGIWAKSDPDRIAELRARQRQEDQELHVIQNRVTKTKSPQGKIDPNTATEKELQSIKGVGPGLAKKIIDSRPYTSVDDLLRVGGIGRKNLEKIREYLVIDNQ